MNMWRTYPPIYPSLPSSSSLFGTGRQKFSVVEGKYVRNPSPCGVGLRIGSPVLLITYIMYCASEGAAVHPGLSTSPFKAVRTPVPVSVD